MVSFKGGAQASKEIERLSWSEGPGTYNVPNAKAATPGDDGESDNSEEEEQEEDEEEEQEEDDPEVDDEDLG